MNMPLPEALQALRDQGAQRIDPVRFHYLETLAARLPEAQPGVRRILDTAFRSALADYEARFAQAQQAARAEAAQLFAARPELAREMRRLFKAGDFAALRRLQPPPASPLAELNGHIRRLAQHGTPGEAGAEMKSVRRFHELWSKLAAVDQVEHAQHRGPENAGPLNSHMLVLNSLALMRRLSPSYLRRFLMHMDTLLWLEQQSQKQAPVEAKPARRSRAKK